VQIDGGRVNLWTGVSGNVNLGRPVAEARLPKGEDLDFITGASMVASRAFYEATGPMREDYFLYYEEADWALRRGAMPLVVAEGLVVFHHAGTSIGSPTLERLASPFSFWFKYHSRMLFVRRFNPIGLPVAMGYATIKAVQLLLKGAVPQAGALLRAVWGLGAPKSVRDRLSPEAQRIAFGRADR
jgi:GT2 family glycosyltransferase